LIVRAISIAGELAIKPVAAIGKYSIFVSNALTRCFFPPVRLRLLFRQLEFIGNRSFSIIVISGMMIGAVFGFILGDIFRPFGAETMLGAAAGIAMSKELAPVLSGFLVTARGGSSMAAEIATMRVNEQIDAMRVMAVNPYGYLVAPRVLATAIMLPLLTCIFILTGVFTSFVIGVTFFDVDVGTFFEKMRWMVKTRYIFQGMQKAGWFGLIVASIGCYKGFYAGGGAKGVGRATTEAVVISLVAILVADFILSYMQYESPF
jgi:phospholipid/cholesterol/gamma-HCH transport system permease protein